MINQKKSYSKQSLIAIGSLAIIKLIIQVIGNRNYGFHRDELLHLSASEHLEFGFYEFPPFIAFIGKLSYLLFDYALQGVRIFPTLAGVAILILCCLMAKEMGGGFRAMLFSGLCILAFIPFYRNHTLFQPVAFNQLFWTISFYLMILYLNTGKNKFLILTGLIIGIGFLNKYTILIVALALVLGLLIYQRKVFKEASIYWAGIISFLIVLPNLIWQWQNDFPILRHLNELKETQLDNYSYLDYLMEQLEITPTFLMFCWGIIGLFFTKILKAYRMIGFSALFIFLLMWVLKSKSYYVFGLYPLLFASGAITIESLLSKRPNWVYAVAASVILPMIYFIPQGTPILPIEKHIEYAGIENQNGRYELTNDYADMFGWEEQVNLVDSLYKSLSPEDREHCTIWAENYGEAGALKILGKKKGLPNPISRHGSFWKWGYGDQFKGVWISIGNESESVEFVFEDVELVKIIRHPYAIEEENEIPLYLCRNPKIDVPKWWKDYEPYVFN